MNKKLLEVVSDIEAARLYRGRGGEMIREAVCRFIECLAKSRISLPEKHIFATGIKDRMIEKETLERFQETIDENLKHPNEAIVNRCVDAFKAFSEAYYMNKQEKMDIIINKYDFKRFLNLL